MKNINTLTARIESTNPRSAWSAGVKLYALELLEGLQEGIEQGWIDDNDILSPNLLDRALLNGASSWSEYSWGGCSLIYNGEIAERLCTASELKQTRNGERKPNKREEWLDTQARALHQAASIIRLHAGALEREEVGAC